MSLDDNRVYKTAFQLARWVIQPSISHDNIHVHSIKKSLDDNATLRQQVLGFHRMYDMPVRTSPMKGLADVSDEEIALRIKLNVEEVLEWLSKGLGLDAKLTITCRDGIKETHFDMDTLEYPTFRFESNWDSVLEEFQENNGGTHSLETVVAKTRKYINVQELADASGDVKYVFEGSDLTFGIPSEHVSREIHASNMTKPDENGRPIRREDGKILKGPNYMEPQLHMVINYRQAREGELNHG